MTSFLHWLKINFDKQLFINGIWHENQAIVALLGLCPLLAVSNTLINSLGLGIATTLTLLLSNLAVSSLRHWIPNEIRLPIFVLLIACSVTLIELIMQAWFYELYKVLGIFIPLIVTNCAILGRAELFACRHNPIEAAQDGLAIGIGFSAVLVLLGGIREAIGSGTLFSHAELLFGQHAIHWKITLIDAYHGALLAVLPPGAFLGLGFLIALKNFCQPK